MRKIDCGAWLKEKIGEDVVHWYPNPGNAGDHLIAVATECLLQRKKIAYEFIRDANRFESIGKIVCYGGGGNLIPSYRQGREFISKNHRQAKLLIILPQTIDGNEDLLASLDSNTTIMCREAISFEHCCVTAPKAKVLLTDDLALSLTGRRFLDQPIVPSGPSELITYLSMRRVFRDFAKETVGWSELTVWRGDAERHPARHAAAEHDLSRMFALTPRNRTPNQFRISASFFLSAIDRFDLVRTDRLHVAIGAAILGKKVELHDNSYYKNRAVYDLSLRSIPEVAFVEQSPHSARDSHAR